MTRGSPFIAMAPYLSYGLLTASGHPFQVLKPAEILAFLRVRTLRSCAFLIDNGSLKRYALAALGALPERSVRLASGRRTAACSIADLALTDVIAHADDHGCSPTLRRACSAI